jgi:hypothetical protein
MCHKYSCDYQAGTRVSKEGAEGICKSLRVGTSYKMVALGALLAFPYHIPGDLTCACMNERLVLKERILQVKLNRVHFCKVYYLDVQTLLEQKVGKELLVQRSLKSNTHSGSLQGAFFPPFLHRVTENTWKQLLIKPGPPQKTDGLQPGGSCRADLCDLL